jgi:hypothetical protein
MFALSSGATPQAYLNETLDRIRQEKTWGVDPLRIQLRGPNVEALLQEYLRQNPRDETGETTRIPVFLVELPLRPFGGAPRFCRQRSLHNWATQLPGFASQPRARPIASNAFSEPARWN